MGEKEGEKISILCALSRNFFSKATKREQDCETFFPNCLTVVVGFVKETFFLQITSN